MLWLAKTIRCLHLEQRMNLHFGWFPCNGLSLPYGLSYKLIIESNVVEQTFLQYLAVVVHIMISL